MKAGQRLGPFVVEAPIGRGAMGEVYRARYEKTGQPVAIKMVPPEMSHDPKLVARFERELNILRKLRHPHIVQSYGAGRHGTLRFYAMEFVDGGSLLDVLKERGAVPWEDVVRYGKQVCEALQYAHEQGIIHRDLKPANLLLTNDGTLKLSDFGIARDNDATALTAAGRTVGTYAYMAPEQIKGNPPISHKTDLYALGCVLYELLSGQPPFEGRTPVELFYQHLEKKPERVMLRAMECPVWLNAVVMNLLEKDPEKRPFDAGAVVQALDEVMEKVASQTSLSQHVLSGEPTSLNMPTEGSSKVRDLVEKPKKKRKKTEQGPLYERTWFLATALSLGIALVVWTFWPLSEQQLFQRAERLMQSEAPADWDRAKTDYLDPLRSRFPSSSHLPKVDEFLDQIAMHKAEERLKFIGRLGQQPTHEGESLLLQARQFEQFGDRVTAIEKYRGLLTVLPDTTENRVYRQLARRNIAKLETEGSERTNAVDIVTAALERAEKLYTAGNVLDARRIWSSVVSLYAKNQELEPLVAQARARLEKPGSQ